MPSMVVTLEPEACPASTVQDFTARPSIWTTQAPHWLVSQPTCVPVRFRWSRRTWTRSVRSSTSTETALPFTVSLTVDTYPSPNDFCLGGLETGEANFATGNFVAVVTERSSDMSGEVWSRTRPLRKTWRCQLATQGVRGMPGISSLRIEGAGNAG